MTPLFYVTPAADVRQIAANDFADYLFKTDDMVRVILNHRDILTISDMEIVHLPPGKHTIQIVPVDGARREVNLCISRLEPVEVLS